MQVELGMSIRATTQALCLTEINVLWCEINPRTKAKYLVKMLAEFDK